MNEIPWQIWIDVGGTFTDCVARRPDGRLIRRKVLSSGVTKGTVGEGSNGRRIIDRSRHQDPDAFWNQCLLRMLDDDGNVTAESNVASFEQQTAALYLAEQFAATPYLGQRYELIAIQPAPLMAIRQTIGLAWHAPLPPLQIRLGTTRGTNALLTRQGARTAFVTTEGFGDILRIGNQNRPRLFDLAITKPAPLFSAVVEIRERVTPSGAVLIPIDVDLVRAQLQTVYESGIASLAICLLNSYCQPQHEIEIERIAREMGFADVSVSHKVAPLVKLVPRGDTTVLDAYLNPVLRSYIRQITQGAPAAELSLLTSAGSLVGPDRFTGKDSILSGPAGGVVGFSKVAQSAGFERSIGFDMGGTSTDVSRFDGTYELEYETEKAGVRVFAPTLAIETVAAGGGSICSFDGVKLTVGPASAGAHPGPASYGRGGPLTVTDINLFLGRILPDQFPFALDRSAVQQRLEHLCEQIHDSAGVNYSPVQLTDGFRRVANANMARAIHSISIAKGYDPRNYLLVAFGGAAPQHACAVADELGITNVLIHPDAGLLSAYGMGLADITRHQVRGIYKPLTETLLAELAADFCELETIARAEVAADNLAQSDIHVTRSVDLRYHGVEAALTVAVSEFSSVSQSSDQLRAAFADAHRRLYGYVYDQRALEIVAVRVAAKSLSATRLEPSHRGRAHIEPVRATTILSLSGAVVSAACFKRADLSCGSTIKGPAIVADEYSTIVIDPNWQAETLSAGELLLSRIQEEHSAPVNDENLSATIETTSSAADPVLLEIFNNQFAGIAERMGITLRNTASSVNVKERLDFSCAIFSADGDLIVNAPHIPVHLGAMSETVKQIKRDNTQLRPGDVFVTNDPYRGGSHLPDITVVTPIHDVKTGELQFFTGSRAHHAEIGGIAPGSMPPFSKNLAEEGVLIQNFKLIEGVTSNPATNTGRRVHFQRLRELLSCGPRPSRDPDTNLADIQAQVAANQQGALSLLQLIEARGWEVVSAYMRHLQAAAEQKMRAALRRIVPGVYRFQDCLDDGAVIAVAIEIDEDSATIDFTGTSPILSTNLNANRAIVTAAVMYCLRCLIDEDIPLNQGVLNPVRIVLPTCLLNPTPGNSPETSPAVAGGNVETSQRIVDVILGALNLAAASQGTMNNLLFGDQSLAYYETICGGAGATRDSDGADAIHTHMTNTRITDPEVLEQRFPVRLREFSIRRNSGGAGLHRGGDGVIRRLEFLRDMRVSILSQRRGLYLPFGLAEGQPGAPGRNTLIRADGTEHDLPGCSQLEVHPGDQLVIETPGGGAWGRQL